MTSVVTFSNTLKTAGPRIQEQRPENTGRAIGRTLTARQQILVRKNAGKENKTLENVLEAPGNDLK